MSKSKGGFQRYTPVLKWKRGEMWAFKQLKAETKDKIIPLLDFLPHASKPIKTTPTSNQWGGRGA